MIILKSNHYVYEFPWKPVFITLSICYAVTDWSFCTRVQIKVCSVELEFHYARLIGADENANRNDTYTYANIHTYIHTYIENRSPLLKIALFKTKKKDLKDLAKIYTYLYKHIKCESSKSSLSVMAERTGVPLHLTTSRNCVKKRAYRGYRSSSTLSLNMLNVAFNMLPTHIILLFF